MVVFGNFEKFIKDHGITKPDSTRILERAAAAASETGGVMISGSEIGPILGDARLSAMFNYDMHSGDSARMLEHWQIAMDALGVQGKGSPAHGKPPL